MENIEEHHIGAVNVNLKLSIKVLGIFHNLKGYDSHLIFKELGRFDVKISVMPNGLEKYMVFTVNKNVVFIDSMQFMNRSLDSLVKNLVDEDFKYLSEKYSGENLGLVKEKGLYAFEYMSSFKRFNEDKLPDRSEFFSSLKNKCVSNEEYDRAVEIWDVFKIKALGEYHNLHLKTDVLLLADAFEKFINTCLNYYGLDPCHYFSSPGLSFDAMFIMTGVELFSDEKKSLVMLIFIYLLKKEWKVVFHIFLKEIVIAEKINLLCIGMQIIYMDLP